MSTTVQSCARSFEDYWASCRDDPIYVVLGVQGSGTNLLSRLLRRTFGVSVLRDRSRVFNIASELGPRPEASEVRRAFGRLRAYIASSGMGRGRRQDRSYVTEPFRGLEEAFDVVRPESGAELARLVYAYRAFSLGAPLMAIKSDDLWERIAYIDDVLPNRRVILITRDFRDNLVSVTGKHFGPVEPVCAALYVRDRFRRYEQEYARAGSAGHHVRFEELLSEPGASLERLGRFFGWQSCVDPHEVGSTFRRRPNKVGRFALLSSRNRMWCEALLRDELVRYGYELEFAAADPPAPVVHLALRVKDAFRRVPQKVRTTAARLGRSRGSAGWAPVRRWRDR
jgi:hypothetical protein